MKKFSLTFVFFVSVFACAFAQANLASQVGKVATAPIQSSYDIHNVNIITLVGDTLCLWYLGDDMHQTKFGGIILRRENGFSYDERKLLRMERGQTFQKGSVQERLVSMFFSPDKESYEEVFHKPFGAIKEWRTFGFPFKDHSLGNDSVTTVTITKLEVTFDAEGYAWMAAQKSMKTKVIPLPSDNGNYYYTFFFWVLFAMFFFTILRVLILPKGMDEEFVRDTFEREIMYSGVSYGLRQWLYLTQAAMLVIPVLLAILSIVGSHFYDYSYLGFVYLGGTVASYLLFYVRGDPYFLIMEAKGDISLKIAKWWFAITSILGMFHCFVSIV